MMFDTYIYALCDPRTGERRYVGKTTSPRHRLCVHRTADSTARGQWIADLKSVGEQPKMEILETLSDADDWRDRELFWIRQCIADGCDLLNGQYDMKQAREGQNPKSKPHGSAQRSGLKTIHKTVLSELSALDMVEIREILEVRSNNRAIGYFVPARNLYTHADELMDYAEAQEQDTPNGRTP